MSICGVSPNTVCSIYVGAISRRLVSNEDVPLCTRDHAWRDTVGLLRLKHADRTVAQAVIRQGRSASGVD